VSEPSTERKPLPRASLADVALAARTSKPIASRILNGDPTLSVSRELRDRVVEAARDLGYRPHAAARALRRAQTGSLGMLVPPLELHVYIQVVRGAFSRATEREFTVLLAEDFEEQPAGETFARLVLEGRIDGLLIASTRPGHPLLQLLEEHPVPHVFVNRAVPGSGRNVVLDERGAAQLVLDHLAGLGHSRIALVAGPLALEPAARLARAFSSHAEELGLEQAPVVESDLLEAGGARAVDVLLEEWPEVTAVFASTVNQAVGITHALHQRGIRIPQDLSVAAHADMPLAEFVTPPLTAVHVPLAELGAAGVDALIEQIRTGELRSAVVDAGQRLVVRESTASPSR
jgi:DNA-binding LacI/PurR family transcriptional regulator